MKRTYDYSKLRGRIIEIFGSYRRFAEVLGITPATVSGKLNGKNQFSQDDIVDWCNALLVPVVESGSYFFVEKVENA